MKTVQIDGQMDIFDFLPATYGDRGCKLCQWYVKDKQMCSWEGYRSRKDKGPAYEYPTCSGECRFEPSEYKVRMCANCKYSNDFCYQTKPQYEDAIEKRGYSREAADDPVEEPNIYCTHREGSLNRHTAYKDIEWPGFGVGHWHRQHEWDICDRWELDRDEYPTFSEVEEG